MFLGTEGGGGGLLDIGIYLIQMAVMVFGVPPVSYSTKGYLLDTGKVKILTWGIELIKKN